MDYQPLLETKESNTLAGIDTEYGTCVQTPETADGLFKIVSKEQH